MAYLELTKEAYNDIINAAGLKASAVARVCETQGVWSAEAAAEEPVVTVPETTPVTTYHKSPERPPIVTPNEVVESEEVAIPGLAEDAPIEESSDD